MKEKEFEWCKLGRANYRPLIAGGWVLYAESDPSVRATGATQQEALAAFEAVLNTPRFE